MRLGLVLSGGAARAAFEVGVVQALEEAGLEPTILSGTSGGALNAAGVAAGMTGADLARIWTEVRAGQVYRMRRDVHRLIRLRGLLSGGNLAARLLAGIGWTWFLDTTPLRRTLVRALGGERVPVRDGVACCVSAVEQASGELVRFCSTPPPPHRRTPRFRVVDLDVDHLVASASLPLLFRPGEVDGERFWDGGMVANTPLAPAVAYEPSGVVVVTTETRERPAARPRSLGGALSLLISNVLGHSLAADLDRTRLINELCACEPERTDRCVVELLLVEPVGLDLGDAFDFSPELARRRIALGLDAGRRALEGWEPPAAAG